MDRDVLTLQAPYLASSVEVLLILREVVKGQERVAIAGRPVADPVALPEQTSLPDHVTAVHGIFQVFFLLKHLGSETRSSVNKLFSIKS